jgi:hypothetical protein
MTSALSVADTLFPVKLMPAGASIRSENQARFIQSATAKAIVDTRSNRVVGIVGAGYRLVTNQEAVDWACKCGQAVFPRTTAADWVPHSADGPASGGYCRIDVMHRNTAFDFAGRPGGMGNAFGPFIRVTNSYNGQRALRFDIGLLRWKCSNGLVMADNIVQIQFPHARAALPEPPTFSVNNDRLTGWLDKFEENVAALAGCPMTETQVRELVCGVLGLRPPKLNAARFLHDEWAAIGAHIAQLVRRYVRELGANANAAFNVMTDFATRPRGRGSYHREVHSLQAKAGRWFSEFTPLSRRSGFNLADFLRVLNSAPSPDHGRPANRSK